MGAGAARRRTRRRSLLRAGLGLALCLALMGGTATATAAGRGDDAPGGAELLGGFAVGDGLEALIDEHDGSLAFTLGLGGLDLHWDSRRVGLEAGALGAGWSFGLMSVGTSGGVRVFPASGGVYEADASQPSGLLGYGSRDLVFTAAPSDAAPLAARDDGLREATPYAYTLEQLGGVRTYFDAAGRVIASVGATGLRRDWIWEDAQGAARLMRVIGERGVVTELDWAVPGTLAVRPAANLPGEVAEYLVELGADGVRSVTDPVGGVVEVASADGLVSELAAPSGAVTRVAWSLADDGAAHASRVSTAEASGRELGHREWRVAGGGAPTGWPLLAEATVGGYTTEVSDGATSIRSAYLRSVSAAQHLLAERATVVSGATGERVVQAQTFTYPDPESRDDGAASSAENRSRPVRAGVTHHGADGGSRATAVAYAYDEFGRVVRETAPDGAVTETAYDATVPTGRALPIGHVERRTRIGADGAIAENRYELNPDRTAVVASETRSGRADGALERVARLEFALRADGFVTEQRVYPAGDGAAVPAVTRLTESIDLARGTRTATTTTGADTARAATTTTVAPLGVAGTTVTTGPLGARTESERDALGRLVSATDARGLVTRVRYESAHPHGRNATVTTTPDRVELTEVRDALGRPIRVTDNIRDGVPVDGHVRVAQTTDHPAPGVTAVTDAWGATTTTTVDVFGRPHRVELPGGLVQVIRHDDVAGSVASWSSPGGDAADAEFVAVQRYDDAGRAIVTEGERADGLEVPVSTTEYDGLGRRTTSSDGTLGERVEYDTLGRVAASTLTGVHADPEAAPLRTTNRYDGFGVGVEKIRSDGTHQRSGGAREVDAQGLVRSETDQRGGVTTYEHTIDGLIERRLAPSGQETRYEYDPITRTLARSTVISPLGPTVATAYAYDEITGRLLEVSDPEADDADVSYAYDAFGNTTEIAFGDGRSIRHRYDSHGRRASTTDAAGVTTVFSYDAVGRLHSATQHDGDAAAPVVAGVVYAYDAYGRVSALERDSGTTTRYTFTSVGDVASETTTRGSATLASRAYTYTPRGELSTRVDRAADASGELAATTTVYGYDAFGRLRSSSRHRGASPEAPMSSRTDYEVLVSGDVAAEAVTTDPGQPGERVQRREFEYSPVGELLAITTDGVRAEQAFDAAGNLVRSFDGTEYAYDAANRRIARTADGRTARTTYWADGERRSLADDTSETSFYADGSVLLTEEHLPAEGRAGAGTASYLVGAGRHARTVREIGDEPVSRAYDGDRHGNVVGLLDGEGRLLERAAYTDYGVPASTPDTGEAPLWRNPFGYAGEYTELDGTQPLGVRVYDPHQLRFQTEDVAARHNRYAFGGLDPITQVDPTGRTELSDRAISWIGTGLGAAASLLSVGMAVATAGWSLTLMGVIGVAAEVAALGVTVAQVVDEFIPTVLEGGLERDLDYAAIGLGFGSFLTGALASLDAASWAEDLMWAERQLKVAITWTEVRIPLYDGASQVVDRYRARYLAATNAGQVRSKEIAAMSMHDASDLESTMSEVLGGLKHRDNGLALVHDGIDQTKLRGARQPFKTVLRSRGVLFAPLRTKGVLASSRPLLDGVKARGHHPLLSAEIQELGVAANVTRQEAAARLAVLRGDVLPESLTPSPRGRIHDVDSLDDGAQYPDADSGSVSGSEDVVDLLG